jgi:hypothetical protein
VNDDIATIAAARRDLLEAKRYVRPKPDVARGLVSKVQGVLDGLDNQDGDILFLDMLRRLKSNLYIAGRDILAAPSMALGYIEGALWETAQIQRSWQKEDGDDD